MVNYHLLKALWVHWGCEASRVLLCNLTGHAVACGDCHHEFSLAAKLFWH